MIIIFCCCDMAMAHNWYTEYTYTVPYETVDTVRNLKIDFATDIICKANNKIDEESATLLAEKIYDASEMHDVSYSFLLAIIQTESRFNHNAKSWAGARGLMQLMPMTFKGVSRKHGYNYSINEINDLDKNLHIGTLYLNGLQKRFSNISLVAAGYNGGPGVALKYKRYLAGENVRIPAETKKYVYQVSALTNKYKKILME